MRLGSKNYATKNRFLEINSAFQEKKSDFIEKHKNAHQFLHQKFKFLKRNTKNRLYKTYLCYLFGTI